MAVTGSPGDDSRGEQGAGFGEDIDPFAFIVEQSSSEVEDHDIRDRNTPSAPTTTPQSRYGIHIVHHGRGTTGARRPDPPASPIATTSRVIVADDHGETGRYHVNQGSTDDDTITTVSGIAPSLVAARQAVFSNLDRASADSFSLSNNNNNNNTTDNNTDNGAFAPTSGVSTLHDDDPFDIFGSTRSAIDDFQWAVPSGSPLLSSGRPTSGRTPSISHHGASTVPFGNNHSFIGIPTPPESVSLAAFAAVRSPSEAHGLPSIDIGGIPNSISRRPDAPSGPTPAPNNPSGPTPAPNAQISDSLAPVRRPHEPAGPFHGMHARTADGVVSVVAPTSHGVPARTTDVPARTTEAGRASHGVSHDMPARTADGVVSVVAPMSHGVPARTTDVPARTTDVGPASHGVSHDMPARTTDVPARTTAAGPTSHGASHDMPARTTDAADSAATSHDMPARTTDVGPASHGGSKHTSRSRSRSVRSRRSKSHRCFRSKSSSRSRSRSHRSASRSQHRSARSRSQHRSARSRSRHSRRSHSRSDSVPSLHGRLSSSHSSSGNSSFGDGDWRDPSLDYDERVMLAVAAGIDLQAFHAYDVGYASASHSGDDSNDHSSDSGSHSDVSAKSPPSFDPMSLPLLEGKFVETGKSWVLDGVAIGPSPEDGAVLVDCISILEVSKTFAADIVHAPSVRPQRFLIGAVDRTVARFPDAVYMQSLASTSPQVLFRHPDDGSDRSGHVFQVFACGFACEDTYDDGKHWKAIDRPHPYLRGFIDRPDESLFVRTSTSQQFFFMDGYDDLTTLPPRRWVGTYNGAWAQMCGVHTDRTKDVPRKSAAFWVAAKRMTRNLPKITTDRCPRPWVVSASHFKSLEDPSATIRDLGRCTTSSESPERSVPADNEDEASSIHTISTHPFPSVHTIGSADYNSEAMSMVTNLTNVMGQAMYGLSETNREQLIQSRRQTLTLPVLPTSTSLTDDEVYKWRLEVTQAFRGPQWQYQVEKPHGPSFDIVDAVQTRYPEAETVSMDMARKLIDYNGSHPTVQAVLRRHHKLAQQGPELFAAITEAFIPTDADHMRTRLLAVHSTVQGDQEWTEAYRLRLIFLLDCLQQADKTPWTDPELKKLLYLGVLRGPYRSRLSSTIQKFAEGKFVHGVSYAECDSLQLAVCLDTVLREQKTDILVSGQLKPGKKVQLVRLEGPDVKYEGDGRAHMTTPAPAPAPSSSPVDVSSPDGLVRAVEPFCQNGRRPSDEQIARFQKTFACPWCLTKKNRDARAPEGFHYMKNCPRMPPGTHITFNHDELRSAQGSGTPSPSPAPAPARRTARPGETPRASPVTVETVGSGDSPCMFARRVSWNPVVVVRSSAPHTAPSSRKSHRNRFLLPVESSMALAGDDVEQVAKDAVERSDNLNDNDNSAFCPTRSSGGMVLQTYMSDLDSTEAAMPERYLARFNRTSDLRDDELLCVDSGTTFSMTAERADFISYEPVSDMYIAVANGEQVPVSGRGTVRLLIGSKVVEERGWLHVTALPMRLKSVRLHRRMHPDNAFIATHDECTLTYPSFAISIDDTQDCVTKCGPAPLGLAADFIDTPVVSSGSPPVSYGHAFQSPRRRGRKFVPFPQTRDALDALSPEDLERHSRPSTRDVPTQYVPNSAAPTVQRFTNEELHKLFGNRRLLDWKSIAETCKGGTVTDFGETPLSIGNFVNLKRGRRGKKAKTPPPGHTICVDIGFGDDVSPGGHRYCLVVVDAGSRQCFVYGLRDISGSTLADAFLQLFVDMGNPKHLCRMLCDFDTKLIKGQSQSLLLRRNIRILSSVPYRHSQNGLVENHWATAVRMARAYLQEANLPKKFWFWALRTAFERMNMIPLEVGTRPDGSKILTTPFELFYGQQPDMRTLFPFGCVGYFRRETDHFDGSPHKRSKFQAETYPGIAVGRSPDANGMLFWSPETCRFSVAADYKLDTTKQVRNHWPELLNDGGFTIRLLSPAESDDYRPEPTEPTIDDPTEGDPFHPIYPPWLVTGQPVSYSRSGQRLLGKLDLTTDSEWAFVQYDDRGTRVTEIKLPNVTTNWRQMVDDGLLEIGHNVDNSPFISTQSRNPVDAATAVTSGALRSGKHFRGHSRHVSAKHLQRPCPRFLWQALADPKSPDYNVWLASYKEEYDGLNALDTYYEIDESEYQRLVREHGVKAISTMCIHNVKPDSEGKPHRAKSRTVVLGNEEDRYWTKNDLFAPVIMKHSIRCLVSYAVSKGRRVKQCDAKNAFCHPDLPDDEICVVRPPKGCPFSKPGTYWRLRKTLYGLRRSPRHWYQTFKAVLQDIGLEPCPHDPCVFVGTSPTGGTIYFGTYVDDCLYWGTDDATEEWFETALGDRLKIDFMGDLSYYLGVHYEWDRMPDGRLTVHMSQEGYVYKMLEQHGMDDGHYPVATPYKSGLPIDRRPHDGIPPDQKPDLLAKYQSIVGGLNWLSLSTRPDITAAVSLLAAHLHNPSAGHLDSAYIVLRYLKGTKDWGIRYTQPLPISTGVFDPIDCVRGHVAWPTDKKPRLSSHDRIDVCSDSNWGPQDASHPKPDEVRTGDEVNSLLGAVTTYMGGPLDWSCTREKRCSRSVCESEIKGMDQGVKMVLAIRHLFDDLGATHLAAPTPMLLADNAGGIAWAKSEAITKKMRHVNIREVAVRDSIKNNEISIAHIPGDLNASDLFTKEHKDNTHYFHLRGCLMSPREIQGSG